MAIAWGDSGTMKGLPVPSADPRAFFVTGTFHTFLGRSICVHLAAIAVPGRTAV